MSMRSFQETLDKIHEETPYHAVYWEWDGEVEAIVIPCAYQPEYPNDIKEELEKIAGPDWKVTTLHTASGFYYLITMKPI